MASALVASWDGIRSSALFREPAAIRHGQLWRLLTAGLLGIVLLLRRDPHGKAILEGLVLGALTARYWPPPTMGAPLVHDRVYQRDA